MRCPGTPIHKKESMELVFATHNQNKIKEIQSLLPNNIQLLSLPDIGCTEEIPETKNTLKGNAILKATQLLKHYGYPCFADDTGLEVVALHGAPGVFSARYAGEPKDDAANIQKLLYEMEQIADRRAQFTTVIALCLNNEIKIFKGVVKGEITENPRGVYGFGYDPVFQPAGYRKTFAELPLATKNKISHRALAFGKLLAYLQYSIR